MEELGLDKIIHEKARLRIMSALAPLKANEKVSFSFLKRLLNLSDGNLSAHLRVLEKQSYIEIKKTFVGRKPQTLYWATTKGRKAFAAYVSTLEKIIKGINKI